MRILYHIPSLATIYAGRTIYAGYKHAFEDLGHEFFTLTSDDDSKEMLERVRPDMFMTSLSAFNLKYLDLKAVERQRKHGMKVLVNTPFWHSPMSKMRINEDASLSKQKTLVDLIRSGTFGDVYYNICEPDDPRMEGFEEATGFPCHTVLLAADKTLHYPEYDEAFKADISYIGTYLPEKRDFIRQYVFPLQKRYDVKLYGQDWTAMDRAVGFAQKVGQYFNIPGLRSCRKPKMRLEDERKVYASSLVSINIHEDFQKRFGGDCNERTFKVPLCGGFEIVDDVACIRKYFKPDEEIIIARDQDEWFEKIDYYIRNPEKRLPIIEAGRKRVLAEHTYHNRVEQLVSLL